MVCSTVLPGTDRTKSYQLAL
eukprot:COSAG02_NODE_52940_length_305_cov_0.402913_2_plen_20_part_01